MNYSVKIEKLWDEFINHDNICKDMRQDILNSWIRCKGLNIKADMGEGKKVSTEKLNKILEDKKELIQIALPVMLDLFNLLKESNYSIILTDENAVILKVIGNETIRERKEDVVLCANLFLERLNDKNYTCKKTFGERFINEIKNHNWPGNVRELENVVQRAYYLSKDEIINYSFINRDGKNIYENKINGNNIETLKEREKDLILKALKNCNGNVVEASKLIGIGKSTLYRKIKAYDINHYSKNSQMGIIISNSHLGKNIFHI